MRSKFTLPIVFLVILVASGGYQLLISPESKVTAEQSPEISTDNMLSDTADKISESTTELPPLVVYKSATCGCCKAWVKHMSDNGFSVEAHDVDDLNFYKQKAKLGAGQGSCHTAFIDGYAIEGHVPADDVLRLLAERPDVSGLTAPGMPQISPGMAAEGVPPKDYDVLSYKDGEIVEVFSHY
jgi:hypothetical protein